jgi:HSP20 family protein
MPTFDDFYRLRDELDRLFDSGMQQANIRSVPRGTFPAINVREEKESVIVETFLPGIDAQKVDLTLERNILTIKGERTSVEAECGDVKPDLFHRRERFQGAFSRMVSLPDTVDQDKVDAQYKDGVLLVTIGKRKETMPRQISVKVE